MAEHLDDTIDRASREKWKGETATQPGFYRKRRSRKIRIHGDVVNPCRLIRLPNPAGQTDAHCKLHRARVISELLQLFGPCVPEGWTTYLPLSLIVNPKCAQNPIADRGDGLKNR